MARFIRTAPLAVLSALLLALAMATSASAATYTVDTTQDNLNQACTDAADDCSLRGAVDASNGSTTSDTIVLPAGIYKFDRTAAFGALYIDKDPKLGSLTIQGAGAADTIIDADGVDRVLDVYGADVEVSGVTLRDGYANDYGRDLLAKVTPEQGAALVELPGSGGSARLPAAPGLNPVGPGGIFRQSGGGVRSIGGDIKFVDSVIAHNNAGRTGAAGGILNLGRLQLVRTTVHRNTATVMGGGIATFGLLEIQDSTVSDNVGGFLGGGILNFGQLAIDSSTVSGNLAAGHGGGLLNLAADLLPSQAGLAATVGQKLDTPASGSLIRNSTFSDNAVSFGQGGAIMQIDIGGTAAAIAPEPQRPLGSKLTLLGDTFADNSAVSANNSYLPGLGVRPAQLGRGASIYANGLVDIGNSLISDGSVTGAPNNCGVGGGPRIGPLLILSLGNNVESGNSCFFDEAKNDKVDQDARLGYLRDNGGLTKTRALRAGSPAIDSYAGDSCAETDQRGGARPPEAGSAGEKCDAGAYEANSLGDLSIDSFTDAPDPATVGSPLTYSIVVRNSGPDAIKGVKVTDALPAGVEVLSAPNWQLGTLDPGDTRTLQVIVRPTAAGDLVSTATVSAAGMTDTKPSNDSATTQTKVNAVPRQPDAPLQQQLRDSDIQVNLKAPKTVTIDEFFDGIVVEADCKDEACLRRFREHAAINTGATRIAGFNLTVSRAFLPQSNRETKIRLRPCQSGAKKGRRHQRCLRNLRKAAEKAGTFKVKVVVSAVDAAGNKGYAKTFVKVTP